MVLIFCRLPYCCCVLMILSREVRRDKVEAVREEHHQQTWKNDTSINNIHCVQL